MHTFEEAPEGWALLGHSLPPSGASVFAKDGPFGMLYLAANGNGSLQAAAPFDDMRRVLVLNKLELDALAELLGPPPPPVVPVELIDRVSDALDALVVAARYGSDTQREMAIGEARLAVAELDALAEKADGNEEDDDDSE